MEKSMRETQNTLSLSRVDFSIAFLWNIEVFIPVKGNRFCVILIYLVGVSLEIDNVIPVW